MKQPGPKPHFQFIWGPWHLMCCKASTISFPCFCTQLSGPCMFTRSYHHVSFPQTFFTTILLSLCGHRTISQFPPQDKAQKAWDTPRVEAVSAALLDHTSDAITRACLLTVSRMETGAWLHAVHNSSLGLRMDNETIRVAAGIRLGVPLCSPHSCQHCGAAVVPT